MNFTIKEIIGAKILDYEMTHDYWQIGTDRFGMNINNPIKFYTPQGDSFDMKDVSDEDIVNTIITNVVIIKSEYLKIELDHEKVLEISLENDDYICPEAVEIYFYTGEIMIIN